MNLLKANVFGRLGKHEEYIKGDLCIMGLNFSYLLYFKRDHLWKTLNALVEIAEPHSPPSSICFPGPMPPKSIPLETFPVQEKSYRYDDPELGFAIVLKIEEDDAIDDFLFRVLPDKHEINRLPADQNGVLRVKIGYVYLTIFNDLAWLDTAIKPPDDLVLFEFGTSGTQMSRLFDNSTSIRKAFVDLLEENQGVCGILNRESASGKLFWLNGRNLSEYIDDSFMLPDEIEEMLRNA